MTSYNEAYRPQFHFSARENWLNDPNGLVYYAGEYHLFFQRNPIGLSWGPMTWGHAVSPNLVHWQQLEDAICPDNNGDIWSGSAVVDWHNTSGLRTGDEEALVALYTSAGVKDPQTPEQLFTQCLACSNDRGRTWTKYERNPVIPFIIGANRDPKVIWYAPEEKWVMALYLDGDTYALFSSADLKTWKKLSEISIPGASECPDLFDMPLDGVRKWVFVVGNGDYLVGDFNGRQFHPETDLLKADYGPNYYATQSWSDAPNGRRIQIAWMRGGEYPGMPFNQQMNFPCDLTLRALPEGPKICRLPVDSIQSLYIAEHGERLLQGIEGELFDVSAEIEVDGASEIGFDCRGTEVAYSAADQTITCLGKSMPAYPSGGLLELRILLDRTSLEVFAGGGKSVMSFCILPEPDNRRVSLRLSGAKPRSIMAHELKSAWQRVTACGALPAGSCSFPSSYCPR